MTIGHQPSVPHRITAALAAKKGRRRRTGLPRHLRLHRTLHRVSMERNLRHEASGEALKKLSCAAAVLAALLLLLASLVAHTGRQIIPDPPLPTTAPWHQEPFWH